MLCLLDRHSSQEAFLAGVSWVLTCTLGKVFSEQNMQSGEGKLEEKRSRRGNHSLPCTSLGNLLLPKPEEFGLPLSHRYLTETESSRRPGLKGETGRLSKRNNPKRSKAPKIES